MLTSDQELELINETCLWRTNDVNINGQFAERYNALQPDHTPVSTVTVPCVSTFWVDADVEVPPDVVVVARPRLTCDT